RCPRAGSRGPPGAPARQGSRARSARVRWFGSTWRPLYRPAPVKVSCRAPAIPLSMTPINPPPRPWVAVLLLMLGIAGCAALWVLVSMATGRVCSWMAVVAALDAALLLRLAQVRAGPWRSLWGTLATAACIALSLWQAVAGLRSAARRAGEEW